MSLPGNVLIKRDLGRLIAYALPARLTFDQACMRQGQFSETYVHNLIHEVATANLNVADHWIRRHYAHPALQDDPSLGKTAGAPRAVDFFVTPTASRVGPSLAIEVKWTPSDHRKWSTVLADLYRLKLIKMMVQTTDGIFVILGSRNQISHFLVKLHAEVQKRAIGRTYGAPLAMTGENSKSGSSQFAPTDENGRFLGGIAVRNKLPLQSNGKPRIPWTIRAQFLGQSTVGLRQWSAAVWRIS